VKIFDQKFKTNKLRYILQCLLAMVCIYIVLLLLDVITDAAIIAALGATAFIAFAMPEAKVSRARYMLGGHIIGLAVGYIVSLISQMQQMEDVSINIFAALAVGIAIFLMAVTNTEHPPAAGVSLGIVLEGIDYKVAIVVIAGVIILLLLKNILRPFLKNLV
jgi:CBS-domain-containing membrane protein